MGNDPDIAYAELQAASNFSFLRGASHADELVERATELELAAIGIADRNTLAGAVRAHVAAKAAGLRLLTGARLDLACGLSLLCYPRDRAAYGRLCRLLTLGQRRAAKGGCVLHRDDVTAHAEGQVLIALPPERLDEETGEPFAAALAALRRRHAGPLYLAAHMLYRGDDVSRLNRLAALAERHEAPLVATNDVHYHVPARRPLQDVLTATRERTTVAQAGWRLAANAERHLKSGAEMARLFRGHEDAVARTLEVVCLCAFSLDELAYEYPDEPVPAGTTPQRHLEALTWEGARQCYPGGIPAGVRGALTHELALIAELGYAPYFLTVHDISRFARSKDILCQGRGSAANSAVCYCLGITAVDPAQIDLLFERFVSRERREPPDIDVDFEHERREEVIQYIYGRYGRDRAGLAATVISYRGRSAARDVGKAMGLSEDTCGALAGAIRDVHREGIAAHRLQEAGLDPADPLLRQTVALARELIGFPRHLSQHVGGFVLTRGPLEEIVPIGNGAMKERTFVEWDKDDLEALGLMKVDVLGLGMLTCIRKAFELLARHKGLHLTLTSVPQEDPKVYDMLCRADTIGVFQIESRAQMNMLPRLKPRRFYDLVIEVAIVRPGPIQGDMVHPYLRRRGGLEEVIYPAPAPEHGPPDELRRVLEKTLGVPLFQEQAMRVAIEAAQFTPDEADALRRAMATFRRRGTLGQLKERMVGRMVARGYDPELAERYFRQIEGFGDYGFPGIPRRELCAAGLRLLLAQVPPPGRVRVCAAERPAHGLLRPRPDRPRRPRARRRGAPGGCECERVGQQPGGSGGGCGGGAPRGVLRAPPRPAPGGRPAQGGRGTHRGRAPRALSRCRRAPLPRRHPGRRHRDPGGGGCLRLDGVGPARGAVAGACAGQGAAAAALRGGGRAGRRAGAGGGPADHGGRRAGGRGLPHAPPLAAGAPTDLPARTARRAGRAHGRGDGPRAGRRPGGDGRPRAGAPAAGQCQGRDLHDAGGRDRDREHRRLAQHPGAISPGGAGRTARDGAGPGAARRRDRPSGRSPRRRPDLLARPADAGARQLRSRRRTAPGCTAASGPPRRPPATRATSASSRTHGIFGKGAATETPGATACRCRTCVPDIIAKVEKERFLLRISRTPLLPEYTVVELETGHAIGSFETEAEAAACFAFAGSPPRPRADPLQRSADGRHERKPPRPYPC